MNNPNRVGEIDETSARVVVPPEPASRIDDEPTVEVVLPFPVAGLPAGTPIVPGRGGVTL